MNKYIEEILNNPDVFIDNCVTERIYDGIHGLDEIDKWIQGAFPIHVIIYLLRANGCESEIDNVKKKHSERFAGEREFMCRLAGVEAIDSEGLRKLIDDYEKRLAEKDEKIHELEGRFNRSKPKSTLNDDLWFDEATKELRFDGGSYKFIDVEGGSFWMGAFENDSDAWLCEKPRHEVTLSSFAIGETQVTQILWRAVIEAWEKVNGKSSTLEKNPYIYNENTLPVQNVAWEDCQKVIRMLNQLTHRNFSLPTEAEWEYAARGGNRSKGYKFSGGNILDRVAWHGGNSGGQPHAVGQKRDNELGLYDMSGNVREWCEDLYDEYYYSYSPSCNPKGPTDTAKYPLHMNRGGSYEHGAPSCFLSKRHCYKEATTHDIGLRLVLRS